MNRKFFILLMTAVLLSVSCSEKLTDPTGPYRLSVDKTEIESDGKDAATFVITDANGLVLTDDGYIRNTSFHIEETDEWISGVGSDVNPNVFTSIIDGTYTVTAMYSGEMCENSVKVTSKNRSKYELFHKNVAIYRLTATWCQYCPYMTEALNNVNDYTKDHTVLMEFHNSDEYAVSYNSTMDMAAFLLNRYGTKDDGYPYCIYSISEGSGKRTVMDIQKFVRNQLYRNPARTGVKAISSLKDGVLQVNATVKASSAGKYDLGMAVLRDNCIPTSSSAMESSYDNVVTMITGNFYGLSSSAFELGAGEERQLDNNMSLPLLQSGSLKIVLFVVTENEKGETVIDNVFAFNAGDSIDYRYN